MDKNIPKITGFEILKLVGRGGMGAVYLARQQSLDRPVAVKILPAQLAENPSYLMRFRQEARAAAKIKHPGLVQVLDAGEENGLFYYVMEYISGETTAQRLRRKGRLDEGSALTIAESVAVALDYAWQEARLVHRDIKPDNILIDGDGTIKVADLGLAKLLDQQGESITMSRALIGTPHYCSPEQARGEGQVDCRADIYGLGATLYHFVVGQAPFADTSGIAAMVRSLTDFVPDPMDCHADVSGPMAWLIEKMMARERQDRQRDWHETLDDIGQVMQGRPPSSARLRPRASTLLRSTRRLQINLDLRPPRGESRGSPAPSDARAITPASMSLAEDAQGKQSADDDPAEHREPEWAEGSLAEETAADGKPSTVFRIFLIVAAVLTLLLYLAWFRMEKRARFSRPPAPGQNAVEMTIAP